MWNVKMGYSYRFRETGQLVTKLELEIGEVSKKVKCVQMPPFIISFVSSVKTWRTDACQSFQGDWSIFNRV
jgi:hypothetical protein